MTPHARAHAIALAQPNDRAHDIALRYLNRPEDDLNTPDLNTPDLTTPEVFLSVTVVAPNPKLPREPHQAHAAAERLALESPC